MWWISIISVCVWVAAALNEPRCFGLPACDDSIVPQRFDEKEFVVQGHVIKYRFDDKRNRMSGPWFSINCRGWEALDCPALPRFAEKYYPSMVVFINCPPPRNGSFMSVLPRVNLVPQLGNNSLYLMLSDLPGNSLLTSQHFAGAEQVTHLDIHSNSDPLQRPLLEAGFLAGFRNLRQLYLSNVRLPAGELDRLLHSITGLDLRGHSLDILPATLTDIIDKTQRTLPNLQNLFLRSGGFTASNPINTKITRQQLNTTPSTPSFLKSIFILDWNEKRMTPLMHCGILKTLKIFIAKVEELPDRWIAACPQLEDLTLSIAYQLTSLPAKLLDGAVRLTHLEIVCTAIVSLPDGFFKGSPNLMTLDLSENRLQTISSATFQSLALKSLNLQSNNVSSESLYAIAPLTTLEHLDINQNKYIYDVCEENGYSPLQNLTRLITLQLRGTSITRICRDWRLNFPFLKFLGLSTTKILELHYFRDLIYNRDASVTNAVVAVSNTVTSIVVTEEDYRAALTASGPLVTISFSSDNRVRQARNLDCNCSTYWLRRFVDSGSRAIKIEDLYCSDGSKFESVSADEMCPESSV